MTQGVPAAFFSYCREDSDFALRLAGDLKAAGASVWLDQLDIVPGQRWDRAVEDALATCQRMVVILTPAAVNSTNVMDEVSFALEEGKTVIPVISKGCTIPFRLRRVQYVDFRQDYARGLTEVLKTLSPEQEERRGAAEEDKQALERERLDLERERPAEQARLENKAQQAAERARLEEEHKRAAEQAQLEQERKQVAEQARLEEERRNADEEARREQERKTAEERHQQVESEQQSVAVQEQQPLDQGDIKGSISWRSGFLSKLPVWAKVVVASCGILIVASIVYWIWPRQSARGQLLAPEPPRAGAVKTNRSDGQPYAWIPPGEFQLGCSDSDSECQVDEKPPVRVVRITRGFWLGQTEVTQAAYEKLIGKTGPSKFKGPDRPVERVTWTEAREYCDAVGGRLPTEAEWEYAARAGSTESRYGDLTAIAWYYSNSGDQTHPVGQKDKNPWGLYDMLGNVWEWVADWYQKDYYRTLSSPAVDPKGPATGTYRVLRGSSYSVFDGSGRTRASIRGYNEPGSRSSFVGFRCAREVISP